MADVEEEVMRIRKQIDKITEDLKGSEGSDAGQALDLLKALDSTKISLPILTKTRIGMSVNALRKSSSDDDVNSVAKSLIKAWKKLLPDSGSSDKKESNGKSGEKKSSKGEDKGAPPPDFPNKSFPPRPAATSDDVRLSCRKLITNALRGEGELVEGTAKTPEDLAELIEDTLYQKFKQTNPKYKNQIRSRVFNLKDKKNPELRENVLCGVIAPEKFAVMTSEEMASDEVKNQRKAFVEEGIKASHLAVKEGTKTDFFKCGKCKKNNCTYNQLQTRSADEPMTTFVMCNECGNRWKFC